MMPIKPYGLGLGLSRPRLSGARPQVDQDGKITVCYPDHHKVFTERVWDLFTNERQVDLNLDLKPASGRVRVHRLIVELFVPHLTRLLAEPINGNSVDLAAAIGTNYSVKDITLLVEFIYRGTVDVSVEQLESLKRLAGRLKVPLEVDVETSVQPNPAKAGETTREPLTAPNGATVVLQGARKIQRVQTNKRRLRSIQPVENVITERMDMDSGGRICGEATVEPSLPRTRSSKRARRRECDWRPADETGSQVVGVSLEQLPTGEIDPSTMVSVVQYGDTTSGEAPESDGDGGGDTGSVDPEKEASILTCPLCHYETPYQCRYDSHMRVKHDPGKVMLKCDRCDRHFVTRAGLERHLPSHRDDQETYDCVHCSYTTDRKANFQRHMVGSHNRNADGEPMPPRFHCQVCSFACTYQSQLISHVVHEHSAAAAPFKCPVPTCTYASIRPSNLQKHVNTMHLKFKAVMCDTCGRRFSDRSALDVHVRIHTDERPYRCEETGCNKSFRDHQGLKRHGLSHGTSRPFVCHLCAHACKMRYNLRAHLKRVHNTTMNEEHTEEGAS